MKKKVLIVVHHLTFGGVQKSCMDVLRAIDHDKFDVTLYVRKNRMALADQIDKHVHVIVNDDKTRYYRKIRSLIYQLKEKLFGMLNMRRQAEQEHRKLAEYINVEQIRYEKKNYLSGNHYDVAVAYSGGYEAVLTAQAVDADMKYIFFHGSEDEYHDIQVDILPYFDGLIAVNDGVADLVRKWYPDLYQKVGAIENYVDSDAVRRKATEFQIKHLRNNLVLCSCGRFAKVKGFDHAVNAAALLKKKYPDFVWYFVGDGPERAVIENMIAEKGMGNNIVLTGMQENPYPYINACDIYVQPSRAESHSLTIVEAQILGKPCVSTMTVGGKYLIKDGINGMLADFSALSIAQRIADLADSVLLRNRISENLEKIDYEEKRKDYEKKWNALLEQEE